MNLRQDYGELAPLEVLFRMCEGVTMSARTESRSRKFAYEKAVRQTYSGFYGSGNSEMWTSSMLLDDVHLYLRKSCNVRRYIINWYIEQQPVAWKLARRAAPRPNASFALSRNPLQDLEAASL